MDQPDAPLEGLVLKLEPLGIDLTTRATNERPGDFDGAFNENKLGSQVDVFFYRSGADYDTKSVYNKKVKVNASGFAQMPISAADIATIFGSNNVGSEALVFVVVNYNGSEPINHENHYTVNELRALSLATATWKANLPVANPNFVMISDNENKDNPSVLVPLRLTAPNSSTPAEGTVHLKRVAAKVTFRLTVADEIKVVNVVRDQSGHVIDRVLETWTPVKTAMSAYLQYAFKVGTLGGDPQTPPEVVPLSEVPDNHVSLFGYNPRNLAATDETVQRTRKPVIGLTEDNPPQPVYGDEKTSDFTVYQVVSDASGTAGPFYSYPVTWTPGAAGEPFIKLIIPWNNGQRTKYYYYKVPFKSAPLESNHWYEITLDVQILGGEDTDPVPLEATYKVVDWVPGATTSASVNAARYLSVPKTEWIMYNTNELTIPITSSHDVQIVGYTVKGNGTAVNNAFAAADKYTNGAPRAGAWIGSDPSVYNPFTNTLIEGGVTNQTTVGTINATRPNYNANTSGNPAPYNISTAASWFPTAEITRDQIVLRHSLNNDTETDNYDVAPYYIRIRVRHKDDYTYYKDIIIEQRPAIVIEPQQNTAGETDNNHGYVWIDNSTSTDTDTWKERGRITGDNNKNPNMYIISTSVLPSNSSSVIGDPRSSTPKSASALVSGWNQSSSGPFVDGTSSHRLSNYYQTENSDEAKNVIAPSLRVASSHGKSSPMTYSDALRRCASYQEDGYPAGRWRLPTMAEVLYITTLSSDGKIPELFTFASSGNDRGYWCATGKIDGYNGNPVYHEGTSADVDESWVSGNDRGKRWVRCVYDEWFWENTKYATVDRNTFTWGDQTRESVVRTKAAE